MTSSPDDQELIDRHLAGILEPEEEARLEHLIRTSPEWARQYREAEEMARLLKEGIGTGPAPAAAKRRIHAEIDRRAVAASRPRLVTPRRLAAAAAVILILLGGYALLPRGDLLVPMVYADAPWPLKDLARSSDVLLVGRMAEEEGALGLRLESVLFGDVGSRTLTFPDGLHPGQRIAVFGRFDGDTGIVSVAGRRGIVPLDGRQPWDGTEVTPDEAQARVARAAEFRTLESARSDLQAFLASGDARRGSTADGLSFDADRTARFLGRFPAAETRGDLLRLVGSAEKAPEVRNAGAVALVEADPVGACRELLTRILAGPVEQMHAETEDGYVVLGCLHLIQQVGRPDLGQDLKILFERARCPDLKKAAEAAWQASEKRGSRTPSALRARALRLVVNGHEGTVIPACPTRSARLLVIYRGEHDRVAIRALVNLAVTQHSGVLLLPPGADLAAFLRQESLTRLVETADVHILGIDGGMADALRAARGRPERAVTLLGDVPVPPLDLGTDETRSLSVRIFSPQATHDTVDGRWAYHTVDGTPNTWLANQDLLTRLVNSKAH